MNCALITGGSRGIGRAVALQLARDHNLHIIINYAENTAAAEVTCNEIRQLGCTAEMLQFRVQDRKQVNDCLTKWEKDNPEKFIKVLVNNAGISRDGLFFWMQEKNWDDVMDVSLKGLFNVTQFVVRKMIAHKTGRIINMSSVSGLKGVAGQTNYAAAKAGIIGATKSLAQELGKMQITVNAVAPGFINTDMIKHMDVQRFLKAIALERIGEPDEVAHLVSFLASDKSSYITGEVININGGLYS